MGARSSFENNSWKVVAFTGLFNNGKSFILSKLVGGNEVNKETGFDQITQGLCIKIDRENKILYIDSEGFERAIQKKAILEAKNIFDSDFELRLRAIKEKIYQEFLLDKANLILIVVTQTTYSDQKLIARIINGRNFANKKVIIIHNLYNLSNTVDISKKKEELAKYFNFKEVTKTYTPDLLKNIPNNFLPPDENNVNYEYFQEDYLLENGKNLTIIMKFAKDDTIAGDYYNFSSILYLRTFILNSLKAKKVNIAEEFLDFVNSQLVNFYQMKEKASSNNIPLSLEFIDSEELKKFQDLDYSVRVASTKPKITYNIIPNRIVMNFMGEVESMKNYIPNIKIEQLSDLDQQKNEEGKALKEKIIVELPLSATNYDLPKSDDDENILISQNENGDIELYFLFLFFFFFFKKTKKKFFLQI